MMKKTSYLFLSLLFFALGISQPLKAQFRQKYYSIGLRMGAANYFGDLASNPLESAKQTRGMVGVGLEYKVSPIYSVQFAIQGATLRGDDQGSTDSLRSLRNLSFRNNVLDFSVSNVIYLLSDGKRIRHRVPFRPALIFGMGVLRHRPETKLNSQYYDLRSLGTEGQLLRGEDQAYPFWVVRLNTGIKANIRLTRELDLNIQAEYFLTLSDYLDDVSGDYPDLESLRAFNPLSATLSDRTPTAVSDGGASLYEGARGISPNQTDSFLLTSVGISYLIK